MPIHDVVSRSSIFVVVVVNLFIILMAASFDIWLMPLFLLCGAVIIRVYANRKVKYDKRISGKEAKSIGFYSLFGLAALSFVGLLSRGIMVGTYPASLLLALSSGFVLSLSLAVSESFYFQGEIQTFLRKYGAIFAVLGVMALGFVYHLRVYGTDPSGLLFATMGYGVLSVLMEKTKRLTIVVGVHVGNNAMAYILGPYVVFMFALLAFGVYTFTKKKNFLGGIFR